MSGKKYHRIGIVAAKHGKKILSHLQYEGSMDSKFFEEWFEFRLLPVLNKPSFIVMDNASFHRKSKLSLIAKKKHHTILFLPPYSPELNPIENFWSYLKRKLKKILPYFDTFDDSLFECF